MFDDFFKEAETLVDVDSVRSLWRFLSQDYDVNQWRLPLPLWTQRRFDQDGPQAWEILCSDLAEGSPRPMCIYMHIPFCSSKCGFCDSYSFKLRNNKEERIAEYVDRLCYEMKLWSLECDLSWRPISTVHLGGGTPAYMGEEALRKLVECCRECFPTNPQTEWALESTVESLTPAMIAALHDLGFRRLHVGVQSLEEQVRRAIGRRCSPGEVMRVIQETLSLGWIVSVDLLCGLPFQTLSGYLGGIRTLIEAGVDGFSLYELLIFPQNHRWAEQHGLIRRDHLQNFWMFLAGAVLLEDLRFGKNLFNHWANERDANLYFTFPSRREDCLAMGTIADGVFGNYHYRHPRYTPYLQCAHAGFPGLEGGLRRTPREERLQPLTTAILSSYIPQELTPDLLGAPRNGGKPLIDRWIANKLVQEDNLGGYWLTPSGAWFTGNMIGELKFLDIRDQVFR